ncbi:MAG: hypothetical protein AAGK93_08085, partial [Pseudomonadota bacterium]
TLLLMGRETGFGEDLTLSVKELRIPLAEAESDGAYFIVGESQILPKASFSAHQEQSSNTAGQ